MVDGFPFSRGKIDRFLIIARSVHSFFLSFSARSSEQLHNDVGNVFRSLFGGLRKRRYGGTVTWNRIVFRNIGRQKGDPSSDHAFVRSIPVSVTLRHCSCGTVYSNHAVFIKKQRSINFSSGTVSARALAVRMFDNCIPEIKRRSNVEDGLLSRADNSLKLYCASCVFCVCRFPL